METLQSLLEGACSRAIRSAFADLPREEANAEVIPCQQGGFGHYQCNSAMRLAKLLKKPPREVAQSIVASLDGGAVAICENIDIAGPGFLNFTLSPAFLSKRVEEIFADQYLGAASAGHQERVIVEFSSPNIAKELHVGHLRSTIIGDSLARCLEFLGYNILRLNHLGDWGTQFGMLIAYLRDERSVLEGMNLEDLMRCYRAAKKRFDEDPEFKRRAQGEVVLLQGGDPSSVAAWKQICDISRLGFQEIYDLLGIRIVERGESFYNPYLKDVVEELDRKGLIRISDGAKCIFLEGFLNREGEPLPLMVQKSDGGYNYDTTDMAALRHRLFEEKARRIVIVTDQGQSLHFQMIFKAGVMAGWVDPSKHRLDHVGFGLVVGPDGKKFKTRSGDTEKLIDLILNAISKAKELIRERTPDMPPEEQELLARRLGIGAVKYADLSSHRIKDYMFSYDRMLRFEGNTAVFLLYAYVRIHGIRRKTEGRKASALALVHPSEVALGLHIARFPETLERVVEELLPNRLTDYLYELAERFNAFFRDCRVEGTPEEGSRLLLCSATARVLKQGLELLGLEAVERM